jgi:hypothetical protein
MRASPSLSKVGAVDLAPRYRSSKESYEAAAADAELAADVAEVCAEDALVEAEEADVEAEVADVAAAEAELAAEVAEVAADEVDPNRVSMYDLLTASLDAVGVPRSVTLLLPIDKAPVIESPALETLVAILLVTVVEKLASSLIAAASSLRVSKAPGAASTRFDT